MFSALGGAKTTATATPGTTATSTTPTATPAAGSSLFSKPAGDQSSSQAPAANASKDKPAFGVAPAGAASTGAAALGQSTAGPAPPAQSRLKNKTMDEIITRWATDLTKYQKDFREQAEKVAEWDRMLVENGTKVQKLYGNTVDAERATQEVERQLSSVEAQQDELSSWLDRYEREVDEMVSKQVTPGEQGPDQEREKTYAFPPRMCRCLNDRRTNDCMTTDTNSLRSSLIVWTRWVKISPV